MSAAFKEGQRVKVRKNRVTNDLLLGKIGTVVENIGTIQPLWVVRLDGETYWSDDTGTLLYSDEIETIY